MLFVGPCLLSPRLVMLPGPSVVKVGGVGAGEEGRGRGWRMEGGM